MKTRFFILLLLPVLCQSCISISKMRYSRGLNIDMEWLQGDRNADAKAKEKPVAKIKFKSLETDAAVSDSNKIASVFNEISDSITGNLNCGKNSCMGTEQNNPGSILSFVTEKKSLPTGYINQYKLPAQIKTGKSLPVEQPVYYQRISHHALIAILISIGVAFMILAAIVYELYLLWIPALLLSFLCLALIQRGLMKIRNGESGGMFVVVLAYLTTFADIILAFILMIIAWIEWLFN